jgi:hypothetical protein
VRDQAGNTTAPVYIPLYGTRQPSLDDLFTQPEEDTDE